MLNINPHTGAHMMELLLINKWFTEHTTIGELSVDGSLECLILEDKRRPPGEKVWGETAIPPGRYKIDMRTPSPKFSELAGHPVILPRLVDVPGCSGVLIHPGNGPEDTLGCLLPGQVRGVDRVEHSRAAFDKLFPKLVAADARGDEIWLTIRG